MTHTTMTATQTITLPVATRSEADGGADSGGGWAYWRDVLVEPDGSVLAWDDVADAYTRHHDLTPEQCARARRLAMSVSEASMTKDGAGDAP